SGDFDRRGRHGRQGPHTQRVVPARRARPGAEANPVDAGPVTSRSSAVDSGHVDEIRQTGSVSRRPDAWKADLSLTGITVIWGSTFVLVKQALDDSSPILYVAVRFTVAAVVMGILFRRRLSFRTGPSKGGLLAGVFLFGGYAFQTAGL